MSDTGDEREQRPDEAEAAEAINGSGGAEAADAGFRDAGDDVAGAAEAAESDAAAAASAAADAPGAEPATEPGVSELDAAIGRAGSLDAPADTAPAAAEPAAVDAADSGAVADAVLAGDTGADTAAVHAVPAPVAAEAARRETFVPPTVGEPEPLAAPVPQTVYVQAPAPPKTAGNRGFGILVALIATVAFAALYFGVSALLYLGSGPEIAAQYALIFAASAVFWVPVAAFFIGFVVLVVIVNRGRWWAYVVFGLLVGLFVWASYAGGAAITIGLWNYTPAEAGVFLSQRWLDPFAVIAGVLAREIVIWFGAWIARRGAVVDQRNRDEYAEYERLLAAGPNAVR